MYQGTLTDKNSRRDNGQPLSVKFKNECILEVMTHFSMLIEDCNLKKIQIKIIKKSKPKEK